MTVERDSTMTLEQAIADVESHSQLLSSRQLKAFEFIKAQLATRDAVVSDENVATAWDAFHMYVDDRDASMRAALESLASRKVAVPEGHVLVPVEPTREMLESGHNCIDWCREKQNTHFMDHPSQHDGGTTCEQDLRDAYAAMLNAAPSDGEGEV